MTASIHKTAILLTSIVLLGLVSRSSASEPKALLVAPPSHNLPKFGFSSHNIYGVGERVTSVKWGGIAHRLGLEPGDLILALNNQPLYYHGAWNHALGNAMFEGGWVELTIRDVRTGSIAYRQAFVGYGPVTPKSHITKYHTKPSQKYHKKYDDSELKVVIDLGEPSHIFKIGKKP